MNNRVRLIVAIVEFDLFENRYGNMYDHIHPGDIEEIEVSDDENDHIHPDIYDDNEEVYTSDEESDDVSPDNHVDIEEIEVTDNESGQINSDDHDIEEINNTEDDEENEDGSNIENASTVYHTAPQRDEHENDESRDQFAYSEAGDSVTGSQDRTAQSEVDYSASESQDHDTRSSYDSRDQAAPSECGNNSGRNSPASSHNENLNDAQEKTGRKFNEELIKVGKAFDEHSNSNNAGPSSQSVPPIRYPEIPDLGNLPLLYNQYRRIEVQNSGTHILNIPRPLVRSNDIVQPNQLNGIYVQSGNGPQPGIPPQVPVDNIPIPHNYLPQEFFAQPPCNINQPGNWVPEYAYQPHPNQPQYIFMGNAPPHIIRPNTTQYMSDFMRNAPPYMSGPNPNQSMNDFMRNAPPHIIRPNTGQSMNDFMRNAPPYIIGLNTGQFMSDFMRNAPPYMSGPIPDQTMNDFVRNAPPHIIRPNTGYHRNDFMGNAPPHMSDPIAGQYMNDFIINAPPHISGPNAAQSINDFMINTLPHLSVPITCQSQNEFMGNNPHTGGPNVGQRTNDFVGNTPTRIIGPNVRQSESIFMGNTPPPVSRPNVRQPENIFINNNLPSVSGPNTGQTNDFMGNTPPRMNGLIVDQPKNAIIENAPRRMSGLNVNQPNNDITGNNPPCMCGSNADRSNNDFMGNAPPHMSGLNVDQVENDFMENNPPRMSGSNVNQPRNDFMENTPTRLSGPSVSQPKSIFIKNTPPRMSGSNISKPKNIFVKNTPLRMSRPSTSQQKNVFMGNTPSSMSGPNVMGNSSTHVSGSHLGQQRPNDFIKSSLPIDRQNITQHQTDSMENSQRTSEPILAQPDNNSTNSERPKPQSDFMFNVATSNNQINFNSGQPQMNVNEANFVYADGTRYPGENENRPNRHVIPIINNDGGPGYPGPPSNVDSSYVNPAQVDLMGLLFSVNEPNNSYQHPIHLIDQFHPQIAIPDALFQKFMGLIAECPYLMCMAAGYHYRMCQGYFNHSNNGNHVNNGQSGLNNPGAGYLGERQPSSSNEHLGHVFQVGGPNCSIQEVQVNVQQSGSYNNRTEEEEAASSESDAKQSAAEQSDPEQSAAEQSDAEQLDTDKADTDQPDLNQSDRMVNWEFGPYHPESRRNVSKGPVSLGPNSQENRTSMEPLTRNLNASGEGHPSITNVYNSFFNCTELREIIPGDEIRVLRVISGTTEQNNSNTNVAPSVNQGSMVSVIVAPNQATNITQGNEVVVISDSDDEPINMSIPKLGRVRDPSMRNGSRKRRADRSPNTRYEEKLKPEQWTINLHPRAAQMGSIGLQGGRNVYIARCIWTIPMSKCVRIFIPILTPNAELVHISVTIDSFIKIKLKTLKNERCKILDTISTVTKDSVIEINNFVIYCKLRHVLPVTDLVNMKLCNPYVSGEMRFSDENGRALSDFIPVKDIGPLTDVYFKKNNTLFIESPYSQYRLLLPSDEYEDHFRDFQYKFFLADTIVDHLNTLRALKPSYQDFINYIVRFKIKCIGFSIAEVAIITHREYICEKLLSVVKNCNENPTDFLSSLPFIEELLKKIENPQIQLIPKTVKNENFTKATTTPLVNAVFDSTFRNQMDQPKDKVVRKKKCGLCAICKKSGCQKCKVCKGTSKNTKNHVCLRKICPNKIPAEVNASPEIKIDKISVEWLNLLNCDGKKQFYQGAILNERYEINIGDFVSGSTKENTTDTLIFKVIFLWQNTNDMTNWFHGQIFLKSADTILGSVGDSQELFMQDNCAVEIPLHFISSVLKVERLETDASWHHNGGKDRPLTLPKNIDYFYRKYYNRDLVRFENLPKDAIYFISPQKRKFCASCYRRCNAWLNEIPRVKGIVNKAEQQYLDEDMYEWNYLIWRGLTYRKGTGIFLKNRAFNLKYETPLKNREIITLKKVDDGIFTEYYRKYDRSKIKGSNQCPPIPYCVGYIDSILTKQRLIVNPQDICLIVNILLRPENIPGFASDNIDLNMLYWTEEKCLISLSKITGSCHLSYIDNIREDLLEWSSHDSNRFYFKSSYDIEKSKLVQVPNYAKNIGKAIETENGDKYYCTKDKLTRLSDSVKPLKSLDIFAGCGGLSKGLHQSRAAECHWAVENDISAAQAFQLNNKQCTVYIEDCNNLLKEILNGQARNSSNVPLPRRGEVEMICCGPPCQGFSTMNRFSSNEYSSFKNSLIVTSLSYCDYYRPKYFILENVRNFVSYKCGMILKLTLHCLLQIGYQCTFKILQAGSYGIPQTRRRMIIIATAPGLPLPDFPSATHSFNHSSSLIVKMDGKSFGRAAVSRAAPRRTCTIRDAIGDLPHIKNGDDILEQKYTSKAEYDYRKVIRDNSTVLRDHICKNMSPLNHARICNVPAEPGADWRDLPNICFVLSDGTKTKILEYRYSEKGVEEKRGVCKCIDGSKCLANDRQDNTLIPWFLPHTARRHSNWVGVIGRLSWGGYFSTTLTNPHPLGKQGRVLHPEQHRVVSVRECARSQGFPDSYLFCGNVHDKYKQIGNAVPPPLAYALGREIFAALTKHSE